MWYCCVYVLAKQGESLVHFDHMLDMVERGYQLAVDFAHAPRPLLLAIVYVLWLWQLFMERATMSDQQIIQKIELLLN